MDDQKGWMGQRNQERVSATLKVTYRILSADEKDDVLNQPRYTETTAEQLPDLSKKFHAYHAVTKDISEGGLAITGDYAFSVGEKLEISLHIPQFKVPVIALAEVRWSKPFTQLGVTYYTAGISILALDKDSMDRLSLFLLSEKVRLQNEKRH
jgi:Tfp pilus assembly protein PilZ